MYQLLCKFDHTASTRRVAERKKTDVDESEAYIAIAQHAVTCPAMKVRRDDMVHHVADHWDLTITTASRLAYHQHVHMPVAARWRGIVARRARLHKSKKL